MELIQRVCILFIPQKYQPDLMYLRHIPIRRVHLFTAIQVGCIGFMWVVKAMPYIAILFPVLLVILCLVRKLMEYNFDENELKWLDQLIPQAPKILNRDEPSSCSRSSCGSSSPEKGNSPVLEKNRSFRSKTTSISSGINITIRKHDHEKSDNEKTRGESGEQKKRGVSLFVQNADEEETNNKETPPIKSENLGLQVVFPATRRFSERNVLSDKRSNSQTSQISRDSELLSPRAPHTSPAGASQLQFHRRDIFAKRPSIFSLQSASSPEAPPEFYEDFQETLMRTNIWQGIASAQEDWERKLKRSSSNRNVVSSGSKGKDGNAPSREATWKKYPVLFIFNFTIMF